ncbi:MAG TPA: Asp23/Gls24 family envelope stress response protein [Pseudonocardia sp.]
MRTVLAEAAERGRLDIHPVVLRKIVEHAADGVPGTLRNERRVAGIDVGDSGASARVAVGPGDPAPVDVRLELTLRYPVTVAGVVAAVEAAVAENLSRLAGHRMRSLAVTITGLRAAAVPGRARVL